MALKALSRRALLVSAAILSSSLIACGGGGSDERTQTTFFAANFDINGPVLVGSTPPTSFFENQTLRQIARISAGGDAMQVTLSNEYGPAPLKVSGVHLARSTGANGLIDVSSDVVVTFDGNETVTIPVGKVVTSDSAIISVAPNSEVALSIFFADKVQRGTYHQNAFSTNFVTAGNTLSSATSSPAVATVTSNFWVRDLRVVNKTATRTVITIGDSITDGGNIVRDSNERWSNVLSRRVMNDSNLIGTSVVNAGISAGRLLNDRQGPSVKNRFDRDVLQVPGITHCIVLIGTNDIGFTGRAGAESVTADEIIAGLKSLIDRAKAANVKILVGTIIPNGGSGFFSVSGDAMRQQVNQWIRLNSAGADAVVDFDAAVRDPAVPTRMLGAFNSGDGLHPGNAGHAAMGNAIDLTALR